MKMGEKCFWVAEGGIWGGGGFAEGGMWVGVGVFFFFLGFWFGGFTRMGFCFNFCVYVTDVLF